MRIRLSMQGTWVQSPGLGRFPMGSILVWEDFPEEQLSPCATTTRPTLQGPEAATTEAQEPRARAPEQGKPLH